jgi:hypothetical protein
VPARPIVPALLRGLGPLDRTRITQLSREGLRRTDDKADRSDNPTRASEAGIFRSVKKRDEGAMETAQFDCERCGRNWELPPLRRSLGRDARSEKRNSGPRPVFPRRREGAQTTDSPVRAAIRPPPIVERGQFRALPAGRGSCRSARGDQTRARPRCGSGTSVRRVCHRDAGTRRHCLPARQWPHHLLPGTPSTGGFTGCANAALTATRYCSPLDMRRLPSRHDGHSSPCCQTSQSILGQNL